MRKSSKLKKIICIIIMILYVNIFNGCTSIKMASDKCVGSQLLDMSTDIKGEVSNKTISEEKMEILNYDDVKDSVIRFHVIANSDKDDDQKLKLKVKDKVINYLYPYLNDSKSLEESRKIIKDNMEKVRELADQVIRENKYDYSVKVELSRENFPDKAYGKITLPQGNYEAFRVIIGSGQGRNWWCVMFPPLCFVDESKAQVEYNKTEERIKANEKQSDLKSELNLNQGELNNGLEKGKNNENKIQIKFKVLEVLKGLFN